MGMMPKERLGIVDMGNIVAADARLDRVLPQCRILGRVPAGPALGGPPGSRLLWPVERIKAGLLQFDAFSQHLADLTEFFVEAEDGGV